MLASFLISLIGKRAGVALAKVLPYLLAVLAAGLIVWTIHSHGYDGGVADTEQKYQTAIIEERHRQIEANSAALEAARLRQKELERLLDERNAEIDEILSEGLQDPNANRRAIGGDSVRRLNRIR